MANEIIGFNIGADNPKKFKEYDARLKVSLETLPKKSKLLQYRKINYFEAVIILLYLIKFNQ
jgi:hypothetical protein